MFCVMAVFIVLASRVQAVHQDYYDDDLDMGKEVINSYSYNTVIHNYPQGPSSNPATRNQDQQETNLLKSLVIRALVLAMRHDEMKQEDSVHLSSTRRNVMVTKPWEEGSQVDPYANDPVFDRRSL